MSLKIETDSVLTLLYTGITKISSKAVLGWTGQVWYCGWEVTQMLLLGFYLREALFQSKTNTEKILYNERC